MAEPVWVVLTQAADKIERLAASAPAGPWRDALGGVCIRSEPTPDKKTWRTVADDVQFAPAQWITTMSPVVAAPLAAWLRHAAAMYRLYEGRGWEAEKVSSRVSSSDLAAADFARAVLGVDRD